MVDEAPDSLDQIPKIFDPVEAEEAAQALRYGLMVFGEDDLFLALDEVDPRLVDLVDPRLVDLVIWEPTPEPELYLIYVESDSELQAYLDERERNGGP